MHPERRSELADFYRRELLENVLPFWLAHSIDRDCGGFLTALDRDGTILDTDKGVWQQGRFTWLLGELYNSPCFQDAPEREKWLALAQHGAEFLDNFATDPAMDECGSI